MVRGGLSAAVNLYFLLSCSLIHNPIILLLQGKVSKTFKNSSRQKKVLNIITVYPAAKINTTFCHNFFSCLCQYSFFASVYTTQTIIFLPLWHFFHLPAYILGESSPLSVATNFNNNEDKKLAPMELWLFGRQNWINFKKGRPSAFEKLKLGWERVSLRNNFSSFLLKGELLLDFRMIFFTLRIHFELAHKKFMGLLVMKGASRLRMGS